MRRRFPIVALVLSSLASVALAPNAARSGPTDRAQVVDGENQMGIDLFRALRPANASDNLVVSPFAVAQTLEAMAAASRGTTRTELLSTLHIPPTLALDRVLDSSRNLRDELGELPGQVKQIGLIARDQSVAISPAFQRLMREQLDQRPLSKDFAAPDQVRADINQTVSDLSGLKNPIMEDGTLPAGSKLLAVGSFSLRATWQQPLAGGGDLAFRRLDARSVNARKLSTGPGGIAAGYLKSAEFQAVVVPYLGGRVALLLVVPYPGKFTAVEQSLSSTKIFDILIRARRTGVDLELPAFGFGTRIPNLRDAIAPFGARAVFARSRADLTPLSSTRQLAFDVAVAQTVINVESGGTDEAGGSVPLRGGTAAEKVLVNGPFVFAVVDRPTGALLELGRVVDPTQS